MSDSRDDGGRGDLVRRSGLLRQRHIPIRYLAPNLATLLSLCAGVTAIRAAIEARFELAVALVVLAALLDAVDGRLARALHAQSRFGAELDSLADFVSFGVAPAVLLFQWGLAPIKGLGWIAVLVFACSAALRLARFNSALDEDRPKWQSDYFTGVPAPAGALSVMLPIYLDEAGAFAVRQWPFAVAVYVLVIAGLMISRLPTYSGKLAGERIAREHVTPALITAALAVALLMTYPHITLATGTLIYLALIPVGIMRYEKRRRAWEAAGGTAARPADAGGARADRPATPDVDDLPPNETRH